MSRSVSFLSGAQAVAYLSAHDLYEDDWRLFEEGISEHLKSLFPSLRNADRWGGYYDGDENHIILENDHCEIAIAEYFGVVSLSLRVVDDEDWSAQNLHEYWVNQIKDKFLSIGTLTHQGTFSNGEAVYSAKTPPDRVYSSKEGRCEWLESGVAA